MNLHFHFSTSSLIYQWKYVSTSSTMQNDILDSSAKILKHLNKWTDIHTECWLPEMFYKEVLNAPYALWNGKTESHESLVPLNCYLLFPASNWSLLTQLTNLRKDTSNISVEWWKCNWIFLQDGAQRQVKAIVAFAVFLFFCVFK